MFREQLLQLAIRFPRIILDIDEQEKTTRGRVHTTAVLPNSVVERRQIKRLQRSLGLERVAIMSDQELTLDQEHIGLDAAEAVVQRVEKRMTVQVIVMRMRVGQLRDNLRRTAYHVAGESANQQYCGSPTYLD